MQHRPCGTREQLRAQKQCYETEIADLNAELKKLNGNGHPHIQRSTDTATEAGLSEQRWV
jgi:hypothetical protein